MLPGFSRKALPFLIVSVILFTACDKATTHVIRHRDGKVKEMWTQSGPEGRPTVRHGTFRSWYADGSRESEVEYAEGRRNGDARLWSREGSLAFEGRYRDDFLVRETRHAAGAAPRTLEYAIRTRPARALGPDGDSIDAIETCAWTADAGGKSVRHGLCRLDYAPGQGSPEGAPLSTLYWSGGRLHGPFQAWHPDGLNWMSGAYAAGVPDGAWRTWSRAGKPLLAAGFARGERDGAWQEWFADGAPKSKGTWKSGTREGTYQEWYPNGKLRLRSAWKQGRRAGGEEAWYPDGARLFAGSWSAGRLHGDFRQWYPGGRLRLQCSFREGRKQGTSRVWHRGGGLLEQAQYLRGGLDGPYKAWTPEGTLITAKEFRAGEVAFDSKAKELLELMGAAEVKVPVGVLGFYWGMGPAECRAHLALLQASDVREGGGAVSARLIAFADRRPTQARVRLRFNAQDELWGIKVELAQRAEGDYFTLCENLEREIGDGLGTAGIRKAAGARAFDLARHREWGRFSVTAREGDSGSAGAGVRKELPVLAAETFSPGAGGWLRFELSNHLYREYADPGNASITPPEWSDGTFLAGR